jgi:tetratricopeptide (TPR) repeat protein
LTRLVRGILARTAHPAPIDATAVRALVEGVVRQDAASPGSSDLGDSDRAAHPPAAHHPVAELDRLLRGEATPAESRSVVLHLLGGCEPCRQRAAALLHPVVDEAAIGVAVDNAMAGLLALGAGAESDRRQTAALASRIEEVDGAEARRLAADLPPRRGRALARRLIDRCRELRRTDPDRIERLAALAVEVGERAGDRALSAEAWAELGNARRIAGDLKAAERALDEARRRLLGAPAGRPARAEVLVLRGALANDQRRFDDARRSLRRAARLYALEGDRVGVARSLLQLSQAFGESNEPRRGVPAAAGALELLDAPAQAELRWISVHTLIFLVDQAGDPAAAKALLDTAAELIERRSTPRDRLRTDWLRARVERDLGNDDDAAALLVDVRRRFLEADLLYDWALVSLDLASVYARQRRRRELAELATRAREVFDRLGVHRESLASLGMLVQAEAAEAAERIAALAAELRRARHNGPTSPAPKP